MATFHPGRKVTFETGPRSCHLEIERASSFVLSGGDAGRIERIATYLKELEITISRRKHVTVHGYYNGTAITAFSTGIGPASVSATLPEVIEACPSPDMYILRLGTAGGLQSHLHIGDLVVTERVDPRETTSDKIMGDQKDRYFAADAEISQLLFQIADEDTRCEFQQVYRGETMVTDELYFFNRSLRNKKEPHNALALSMEFSAYCALRDAYNTEFGYNIRTGEILTISDLVVPHETISLDRADFMQQQQNIEEALILTGLETLVRIDDRTHPH